MVQPDLDIVSPLVVIEIVENDSFFTVIAVEPLVLRLDVHGSFGILMSGVVTLASAGLSPEPDSSNFWMLVVRLLIELVGVDSLLYSVVVFKGYNAFFECFSRSHGNEFHVLSCAVSLLVDSAGTNPKCPRTFKSGFLLVAIFCCAIIFFN